MHKVHKVHKVDIAILICKSDSHQDASGNAWDNASLDNASLDNASLNNATENATENATVNATVATGLSLRELKSLQNHSWMCNQLVYIATN